jgi:predicted Zn-dependent protease
MTTKRDRDPRLRAAFDDALRIRDTGDTRQAIACFRALAREWPDDPAAVGMLAGLEFEVGDYESACMHGRLVTRQSPRSQLASHVLFLSLCELGRLDEAFAEIARFRALRPSQEFERTLAEMREGVTGKLRSSPFDRRLLAQLAKIDAELAERPINH